MSYKPGDFLIGVSELVSIVLPGAIGAYLLAGRLAKTAERLGLPPPEGAERWAALGLAAYLLGHLIFLAGSILDPIYDWLREWFFSAGALASRLRKRFGSPDDLAYEAASEIALAALGTRAKTTNTYKYATALLTLRSDAALAEVRQFEADSKFFRSLTVLSLALVGVALADGLPWEALAAAVMLAACFWRYVERRWKATRRAFQYVVVLDTLSARPPSDDPGDFARGRRRV